MPIHVRVGGTWREITDPQVRVGGSWRPVTAAHVKTGGVWRQVHSAASGPSVSMNNYSSDPANVAFSGTVYDQYRIDNDGTLDRRRGTSATYSNLETWLDAGTTSQVWVSMTSTGSALDSSWAGRLPCTSDRFFGYILTTNQTKSGTVTVTFWDAASGGNVLDTATVNLYAKRGF